jgi:hypothetical protein
MNPVMPNLQNLTPKITPNYAIRSNNFFLLFFASTHFVVICSLNSTSNSKEGIRFCAFKFRFRPHISHY